MALQIRNVLITDSVHSTCANIFRGFQVDVVINTKLTKDELLKEIKHYDALIVRSATKVTADVIEAGKRLKLIGRAGTGVDNIDVEAATRWGILVMNTPGGNTLSAAEHTCIMIASLSRMLPAACASLKQGHWDRKSFMGRELYGKTLGVIGLGRIGKEVATRMQAFGMKTIGFDPIVSEANARSFHVKKVELEEIWAEADYITVHTPLIPQTRNLLNTSTLAKCKRGVQVVNVARGGIIEEDALLDALNSGQVAAAALDVFLEEPPRDRRLIEHPRVICTPHLGANTYEAQERVAKEIAEQIMDGIEGRPLVGLVNAHNLSEPMNEDSQNWILLGRALGTLVTKLTPLTGPNWQLEVTSYGRHCQAEVTYLSTAVQLGMLSGMTQNGINMVNASVLAKEAGITMKKTALQQAPPEVNSTRALGVKMTGPSGVTHELIGTVQGDQSTLYVIDGAVFESGVTFGRNMLFFHRDQDVTGLAEIIGTLAQHHLPLVTVLSSKPTKSQKVWYVVKTAEELTEPEKLSIPNTKLALQMSFDQPRAIQH